MSKADVLSLVQTFALDQADTGLIDRFYDDTVISLSEQPLLVQAELVPVTLNQATFTLPASALTLHWCFYMNRQLDYMDLIDLEVLSPQWRDHIGVPVAYTSESEDETVFRLYPRPAVPSTAYDVLLGPPFGAGFPSGQVFIVYSHGAEVPRWLELAVTLRILTWEFSRESSHKDAAFVRACQRLATLISQLRTI